MEQGYELIRRIGAGSFGCVYEAVDTQTKTLVAVKVLSKWEEARDEAEVMKCCGHHKNIVKLEDLVYESGKVLLVLEKMDMDLGTYLSSRRLSVMKDKEIRYIMHEIIEGLRYIHEDAGIMHLDVKPSNILVNVSKGLDISNVKLGDFGLARSLYGSKSVGGTLAFNAPELLMGKRDYGPEVDIWAAGCIFMMLLLGREDEPFEPMVHGDNGILEYKQEVMKMIIRWIGPPTAKVP